MNRIITILVTIFILLLLYIWISHVWGSDNPRHPKPIVDATDHNLQEDGTDADTSGALSSNLLDDEPSTVASNEAEEEQEPARTDEFNTERQVPSKSPSTGANDEISKPMATKTEEKPVKPVQKIETPTKPNTTSKPSTTPSKPAATPTKTNTAPVKTVSTPVHTDTDGKHLVIAGNFSQKANAQQRVSELKKAGFGEAEVVNFDLSEYHTVCAGRFEDVNEARKLVKKLKDYHKIDAYVRIGS